MRHFIRDAWLSASYYAGISRLYHALCGRKKGILSLHNILNTASLPGYDTYNVDLTMAVFDKQLAFLTRHFPFRPIRELASSESGFFITADDGMRNNYSVMAPILDKYGLTAMFAICPDLIDRKYPFIWRDHIFLMLLNRMGSKIALPLNDYQHPYPVSRQHLNTLSRALKRFVYRHQLADPYQLIAEIMKKNQIRPAEIAIFNEDRFHFMSWEEIASLSESGHQIASHTMTHRIMCFLDEKQKRYELEQSRRRISEVLKIKADTVVYPYGSRLEVDQDTVRLSLEAGYTSGFMNIAFSDLTPQLMAQPRFGLPQTSAHGHLYAVASGYKLAFTPTSKR